MAEVQSRPAAQVAMVGEETGGSLVVSVEASKELAATAVAVKAAVVRVAVAKGVEAMVAAAMVAAATAAAMAAGLKRAVGHLPEGRCRQGRRWCREGRPVGLRWR